MLDPVIMLSWFVCLTGSIKTTNKTAGLEKILLQGIPIYTFPPKQTLIPWWYGTPLALSAFLLSKVREGSEAL